MERWARRDRDASDDVGLGSFKRAALVRYQLQQQGMPVDDAPEDDDVRETYNFPPGAYGIVYRADIPDHGVQQDPGRQDVTNPALAKVHGRVEIEERDGDDDTRPGSPSDKNTHSLSEPSTAEEYKYHLKAMRWGLIPFWTKRAPDYSSMMRTINCRDDSLIENRGMWTSMKQKKRCLVICQGFYEWLKKGPGGKEKIPHFVKRKDGQLMCFAGLWDCVKYEDTEEKLYTYTIITTDSNKQLSFLHDRMPVIFDAGSVAMKTWLDPTITKWSKELQSLLMPYDGELECYPVSKDVGKVGNNSPEFIVPIDSKENKKNIANFFGNARKIGTSPAKGLRESEPEDNYKIKLHESAEDKALHPVINTEPPTGLKRERSPDGFRVSKSVKLTSPEKEKSSSKKSKSAIKNEPIGKKGSPKRAGQGTQPITNFFNK